MFTAESTWEGCLAGRSKHARPPAHQDLSVPFTPTPRREGHLTQATRGETEAH